jgi:flavin reductase (DIM6/NTAB) family NADH-FMN oxidoreductase RutF
LKKSRESVLNIPTVGLASKVVACGNVSGKTVDKFAVVDLTPVAAAEVKPPLIDDCYASLECKVVDTRMVAHYGLFILEVVKARIGPSRKTPRTIHRFRTSRFMVAGTTTKLASKNAWRPRASCRNFRPAFSVLSRRVPSNDAKPFSRLDRRSGGC